jgi:lipopolysaccharide biosynthesis regulator YciM
VDPLLWIVIAVVLIGTGVALWLTFRRPPVPAGEDGYARALELWLEGDRAGAARQLRQVVDAEPDAVDPYLYLGVLLREEGDAQRAAIMHRSLLARRDLSRSQRLSAGLALAEDLIALEQWDDAEKVLDELESNGGGLSRTIWCRFAQQHGQGDQDAAARTLKRAIRRGPAADRPRFSAAFASYQLDRALGAVQRGEASAARDFLKDVAKLPEAAGRASYVAALIAASEGNATAAVTRATEGLLAAPEELSLFLPTLEDVFLEAGQYAKTVPLLESACRSAESPPSLWISLALLYEKLGQRDKALRMLEGKQGDPRFTPDRAAPYLKILVRDEPEADFSKVWGFLTIPAGPLAWRCSGCGNRVKSVRWFCPVCYRFDSYTRQSAAAATDDDAGKADPMRAPVRF